MASGLSIYGSHYTRTPDGAELWYAAFGEGAPTMVLCDGLGCDGFIWKYLAPELAQHYQVVRFHYRGHGKSTLPTDPHRVGVGYCADDLLRVLDAVGVEKAVLFGHSMGVQVLFEMHRRHPERVLGLVPVCGSYGHALDTFHDDTLVRRLLPTVLEVVERFPTQADRLWKLFVPSEISILVARFNESKPSLLKREDIWPYLADLGAMDPRVFLRTLESAAEHSSWSHLPQIDVPTLVIAGEHDKFTPMWLSQRMSSAIPGAELLVIPSASHLAMVEMPQLISLRVERFLRERILVAKSAAGASSSSNSNSSPSPTSRNGVS
jgi:pimeloyl-ACP methyl ester carboxylesterase